MITIQSKLANVSLTLACRLNNNLEKKVQRNKRNILFIYGINTTFIPLWNKLYACIYLFFPLDISRILHNSLIKKAAIICYV